MPEANPQPLGQRLETEAALMGPGPAGDCSRAGEIQLRDVLAVRSQTGQQNADVEAGVVSHQTGVVERVGYLRPPLSEYRLGLDALGRDAVDPDVPAAEVQRIGTDHPHPLVGDLAVPNNDGCQLTGAIGPATRRFEVNCREIRSKSHVCHP